MSFRKYFLYVLGTGILMLAATSIASAGSFAVIAYGDSLSDNGNLYGAIGYPPAPYWNGRFSNGPVAVEQLATGLGAPLLDFAWGGATTGSANYIGAILGLPLPGMKDEFDATIPSIPAGMAANSIFVVWGGANDFFMLGSPLDAATNIDAYVNQLLGIGAKHILVPGIPDLGLTPEFHGLPDATNWSLAFNAYLLANLPSQATYLDTFALLHSMVNNPAAYGFTNVTQPCFDGSSVCANPDQYLFWDGVHPTTAADAFLAEDMKTAVTPEPSIVLLWGTGLLGLVFVTRRALA